MPYKEKEIEKLYYSISEVAEMFEVNTSLIRFWEKEFTILKPKKNKKGNRLFTKDDIENLRRIYHLVKEKGYTLQGAKEKLKEGPGTSPDVTDIISRLEDIKKSLLDLKDQMEAEPLKTKPISKKISEITAEQQLSKTVTPIEISPNQVTLF